MKPLIFLLMSFALASGTTASASGNNMAVPFTSQAPSGSWREPWKNACEETVISIVDAYYRGDTRKTLPSVEATKAILHASRVKANAFGWSLDENADKIARIINNFYHWEARVADNPSISDIQAELNNGRPVIVPIAGRVIGNPHFRNGGPDYHTIVISGWDDGAGEFIVQEPGTRFGLDFRYPYDKLMDAMHDYVPGKKTVTGRKVAIFTSPDVNESGNTDGDKDGLSKADELRYQTVLWLKDSDGDGFGDGDEVRNGYSATTRQNN